MHNMSCLQRPSACLTTELYLLGRACTGKAAHQALPMYLVIHSHSHAYAYAKAAADLLTAASKMHALHAV